MNCHPVQVCLIYLIFNAAARPSWRVRRRRTAEQQKLQQLLLPAVTCSARRVKAVFGPQVRSNIRVTDATGAAVPVLESEEGCGARLSRDRNRSLSFLSRYDGCYARLEGQAVVIPLQAQLTGKDGWFKVNVSCPLIKRRSERTRLSPTPPPGRCDAHRDLRVDCGHQRISRAACHKLGCCYDPAESACYYRLDACSLDGHFVFSIKSTEAEPPIDPAGLVIRDQPRCRPALATADAAVFKIPITDCGVKKRVDGNVSIYELEVEELRAKSANKHLPFSLQVQCAYEASDLRRAADLRSLHAATDPPPVVAVGAIRVRMRLAKDPSFASFFREDQLPLALPLREAAYVEISIAPPSPDPALSLRVRDCFAYPASRHSVWTLLYDGCPNPLDKLGSSVPVGSQGETTSHSQVRRFDVKTFAFLDPDGGHPSTEEMYFYCWVEMCTEEADCAQRCAIIASEDGRRRREATPEPDRRVQLVSVGPLWLRPNGTDSEENPCVRQSTMFQATLCVLSVVAAALLLLLLLAGWSAIRRCRRQEVRRGSDAQSGQ